jgi:Family of unknown function (DUF6516)
MNAVLLFREKRELADGCFVEAVVWRVPKPLVGSAHVFKYRLAYVEDGVCIVRYDNERGKGDHKHLGDLQSAYKFTDASQLLADFYQDVERMKK